MKRGKRKEGRTKQEGEKKDGREGKRRGKEGVGESREWKEGKYVVSLGYVFNFFLVSYSVE